MYMRRPVKKRLTSNKNRSTLMTIYCKGNIPTAGHIHSAVSGVRLLHESIRATAHSCIDRN